MVDYLWYLLPWLLPSYNIYKNVCNLSNSLKNYNHEHIKKVDKDLLLYKFLFSHQEHDGLVERWKHKNMENLLELHNKTPVWNEGAVKPP